MTGGAELAASQPLQDNISFSKIDFLLLDTVKHETASNGGSNNLCSPQSNEDFVPIWESSNLLEPTGQTREVMTQTSGDG